MRQENFSKGKIFAPLLFNEKVAMQSTSLPRQRRFHLLGLFGPIQLILVAFITFQLPSTGAENDVVDTELTILVSRPAQLGMLAALSILSFLCILLLRRVVKRQTRKIEQSYAKRLAVYSSIPEVGILAVDQAGKIANSNDALMFWFPETAELGADAHTVLDKIGNRLSKPRPWAEVNEPPLSDQALVIEALTEDGKRRIFGVQDVLWEGGHGGHVWIFRDITKEKEMEESLVRSSKLEAIGRLTGGIAHDFNNILTGVTGNLSFIEEEIDDPELKECIDGAMSSAFRASALVNQLLDYTKQTRLDLCESCLNGILRNLKGLLRHGVDSRIELKFDLVDETFHTLIDPIKIEQVLMNLMINAIDAQPEGGVVQVTTINIVSETGPDRAVKILVRDEGVGMSDEVMKKIFEPFYSTKGKNGTGLGLATSLGIIEQHGGTLTCRSTLGIGTCFEIMLPAVRADEQCPLKPKPEVKSKPSKVSGEPNVLIIEDDIMVRKLTDRMLRRSGCKTIACENGQEAITLLKGHGETIDLVLSDNAMPVMDGKSTFKHVKENFPDMPFIVMSGYLINLDDYAESAKGQTPDGFIQKPVTTDGLCSEIVGVLQTH